MAAITPAQLGLVSSISQEDIPIKLRCATCSRLALNAFRLPCCDQSICETCQSTLPATCPVCEHSPVASEDCKPHKSLRTTIKVFLRTEEKKREASRLKEAKDTPPATPVDPTPAPVATLAPTEPTASVANDDAAGESQAETIPAADIAEAPAENSEDVEEASEAQQDVPQPSIEEIAPGQESSLDPDINNAEEAAAGDGDERKDDTDGGAARQPAEGKSQTAAAINGLGFDGNTPTGFPGAMGFGGDMGQMQMMMAMQNGMAPNAFGNFPMMGMPGMNIDPMMMQNMFMNGGFGAGMGMNGMNMGGMGMGGFDGGAGGFNNGWNSQQSWNVGPDSNFNHPNAAGMGSGDYGANNSGFTPHTAGYNQGNYGHGNHYNDYQNNGFRGRGRGRGYGYSRGGYGSHDQQYQQQYSAGNQPNGPISDTGFIPTGPKAEFTSAGPVGNVDEFGREIRQNSEAKENGGEASESKEDPTPAEGTAVNGDKPEADVAQPPVDDQAEAAASTFPQPIQTLDEAEAPFVQDRHQNGLPYNQYPARRDFYGARGGGHFGAMQPPVKPVDVPINAPSGPKAMRMGLPNTGHSSHLARGISIASSNTPRVNGSTSVAPEPPGKDEKERDRSRTPSRQQSRSRSPDRKRSRSRERSPERHHRRHRHRSASLSEDEKETERRRQKRKERRRRREEEGDDREDIETEEKQRGKGDEEERSRSVTPTDSKRSGHRSRRDRDLKYRERERDSDREHKSSTSHRHRSSHRSHRDRDERSRSRDRDRDREREHRHRHSRRGSEDVESRPESKIEKGEPSVPPTPTEPAAASHKTSVVSNEAHGLTIKGVSRKNVFDDIVIPTGPRSSRQEDRKPAHRHREDEDRHRSSRQRDDKDKERERERERDRVKEKERTKPAPTGPAARNPHEEEREARNRERLLKEAQRMAGLSGGAVAGSRKRSRDDGDGDRRGKKKGRRPGADESEETRIARLEAERESSRW